MQSQKFFIHRIKRKYLLLWCHYTFISGRGDYHQILLEKLFGCKNTVKHALFCFLFYICICLYTQTHMHTHTYARTLDHTLFCFLSLYICIYIYILEHGFFVCLFLHIYIYIYIYIYIHAHIHILKQRKVIWIRKYFSLNKLLFYL